MMKYLMGIFVIVLIVQTVSTNPIPVPIPWSTPTLLCDSLGDNLNPSFARDYDYFIYNFNILVWERSWTNSSQIFLKNFADPDSEIAITADESGIFSSKPKASIIDPHLPSTRLLIVWQSNENSNFDLYSIEFLNGKMNAYQRITNDIRDDLNPDLYNYGLVWECDSSIYYSKYSVLDSSWSAATVIDSFGCSNPTIGSYVVAYQKRIGNQYKIFQRRESSSGWYPPELCSPDGDNQLPKYSYGQPHSLVWQNRDSSDWNLMNLEWGIDPDIFILSPEDETSPTALELYGYSRTGSFAPLYFSFQTSMSGDMEIYANDFLYDEGSVRNVSQFIGEDRHPAFSEFSVVEAESLHARAWLAWESKRNGHWQIWGSFAETELPPFSVDEASGYRVEYYLHQNYPNPFNPNTTISYQLPANGEVELIIYNLLGQQIKALVNINQPAGYYEVQWNGTDDFGNDVASGIYICQIKVGNFVDSRKMLLIR